MRIQMRPFVGADREKMLALVQEFPAGVVHLLDMPYRLCSWALDYPENVGIWEDGAGNMLAWAVLQTPFWVIDYAFRPEAVDFGILPQIITWALGRAGQIKDKPNGRTIWLAHAFADQYERIGDLERAGFVAHDDWSKVFLSQGIGALAQLEVPAGFTIRPFASDEVTTYVNLHRAAFDSDNMTIGWRSNITQAPDYNHELNLLALAPDGTPAGFCIAWLGQGLQAGKGQIEPMGVRPDYQGQRLGKALLLTALNRLVDLGANNLFVETDMSRNPARQLYMSVGFREQQRILVFGHQVAED